MAVAPLAALAALWWGAGRDPEALQRLALCGSEPAMPSSFAVGTAAQVALAAAALASAELGRQRNGLAQSVAVDMHEAALECSAHFAVDGRTPEAWDPLAGLYPCGGSDAAGGWIRLHTNFGHHRDGVLRLLGLPEGPASTREQVARALANWRAIDFEAAASEAGLVVAAVRSHAEWQAHPQSAAVERLPLVEIVRAGEAPPLALPALDVSARPLSGVRVLDLTRILAGPVAGRTLAAHGADVMLVNAPQLPNIAAIADTSRGKRSALADLRETSGRTALREAVAGSHVFLQGYRPGGLAALGFGAEEVTALRPGIVYASLSAYGRSGPWAARRGFDSLVQTATGLNADEAEAAGSAAPRALPVQILDMAAGFLLAHGIASALALQRREGGSWQVHVSLARTALWLRSLGRVEGGMAAPRPDPAPVLETVASGFGALTAVRHAARFSHTPAGYARASVPPGTDPLRWPVST